MTPLWDVPIPRAPADPVEGGLAPPRRTGSPAWPPRLPAWQPGRASGGCGPRSPLGGGGDGVNDLHDAVQGGVRANGHVGATEVIVDGAHQPSDVQVGVGLSRALGDLAWGGTAESAEAPVATMGGRKPHLSPRPPGSVAQEGVQAQLPLPRSCSGTPKRGGAPEPLMLSGDSSPQAGNLQGVLEWPHPISRLHTSGTD